MEHKREAEVKVTLEVFSLACSEGSDTPKELRSREGRQLVQVGVCVFVWEHSEFNLAEQSRV